jgi:PiT family inorganic phosphate transporter
VHGFAAQLTSALIVLGAAWLGGPVSTTQVVNSAVIGVGSTERPSQVRWGLAAQVARAWLLTIPGTAVLAALIHFGISLSIR